MAVFNRSVLTTNGNDLLVGAVAGEEIEFIRLETGSGIYDGTENLLSMNRLKNRQQSFPFLRYEKVSEESILLVALVSNDGLSMGYRMTEVGVYGKLKGSDKEILCSITTAATDGADFWPPYNGIAPARMLLRYHITISPDAMPCITVSDNMVLAEIAAEANRANAAELALSDEISVLKKPEFEEAVKRENIKTGEELPILLGKIRKWFADLNPISFSGKYIDLSGVPTKLSEFENDSNFASTMSPVFTGTPKAPTPKMSADDTQIATTAFVKAIIAMLVNDAPETLDTLGEVAAALAENRTFIDALNDAIGKKVDKVSGKGLSTNDYTTTEKNKLKEIASGAEVNVQSDWDVADTSSDAFIKHKPTIPTVNNGTLTIRENGTDIQTFSANQSGDVIVDISVPTKVSQIENDSGYAKTASPTFTGAPKAPTPAESDNSTRIATTAFVKMIVSALINGAPETLDTFGEIAEAFAENEAVIDALNEAIGKKLSKTEAAASAEKWTNGRNVNGLIIDGTSNRANYGTCSTAAATAAKTVSCTGFGLVTGAEITVRFTVTNTAANPTLNVNGTGAKPIYYRGAAITAGYLASGRTYIFRYNGTQYDLVGDVNTNTTYSNFVKSGAGAKSGLVPSPGTTAGTRKTLWEDATWHSISADDIVDPLMVLKPDATNNIPKNADLDDYTTPGVYGVIDSTYAATIANTPTTARGYMLTVLQVCASSGSAYFTQFATTYMGTTYARYKDSSGWSSWVQRKYTDTTYGAATESSNGLMSAADKLKVDFTNVVYGTCATAAATAAKVITISGNTKWELKAGAIVIVKFTNTNTARNPTFNVNNTGAKKVWYNTAVITTSNLSYAGTANRPMMFVYDGTQFVFMSWSIDANTTYGNMSAATASAAGKAGLVPAPGAGKQNGYLRGDGTWAIPTNNLLATVAGTPLDAVQGKALDDKIGEINSNLNNRMNFVSVGHATNSSPATISFDMTNYNMVYAVGYASNIAKYVGGLFMPKVLFDMHPQVIDYYNYWSGVVEYNSTEKKFTLTSNVAGYSLYVYAVKV